MVPGSAGVSGTGLSMNAAPQRHLDPNGPKALRGSERRNSLGAGLSPRAGAADAKLRKIEKTLPSAAAIAACCVTGLVLYGVGCEPANKRYEKVPPPTMGRREAARTGNVAQVQGHLRWKGHERFGGVNAAMDKVDGRTMLHEAAANGHEPLVRYLIRRGADVNHTGHFTMCATPLHLAVAPGHKDVVVTLLRGGAQPGLKDHAGRTAHDIARRNGDAPMVGLLRAHRGKKPVKGK